MCVTVTGRVIARILSEVYCTSVHVGHATIPAEGLTGYLYILET